MLRRVVCDLDLDLDLDLFRIQLDTLGHAPTPSVSVKSCHLCFLPAEPHLLSRSWLTVLLQFAVGRPGPLLYPGTCQYSACCTIRWWSIRKTSPSHQSRLVACSIYKLSRHVVCFRMPIVCRLYSFTESICHYYL